MGKRGITVWIFSSLSFLAAIHTLEAILALFFNTEVILLKSYPIINTLNLNPATYLLASTAATISIWGITCKTAVETPVERFLDTMLSDAKKTIRNRMRNGGRQPISIGYDERNHNRKQQGARPNQRHHLQRKIRTR
jgi:type II secretory pathway component PulF